MKFKILFLTITLCLVGCRTKTRLIHGSVESKVPTGLCSNIMSERDYSGLLKELSQLVERAKSTEDLDQLSASAQEIFRVIQELKLVLKEENSREIYWGQYQWKFYKKHKHHQADLKITPMILSVNTVEFPVDQLLVEDSSDHILFTWKKPMSALEYCICSESAFSLIKLEYSDRQEFLRLEVSQKKEIE